ncbi:MAG: hypothetical protein Q8Q90_00545 [bacterium]|nr:hypothetical protein [bacterium]
MKSSSNILKGLLLMTVAVVAGVGYFNFQRSGNLISGESNMGAYVGQTFPPILFFDAKESPSSYDKGCYDLKWSSLNVTSCTSSWRPTVATNGGEKVCLGKVGSDGNRIIDPKVVGISYTITCSGSAGSVSRVVKVK